MPEISVSEYLNSLLITYQNAEKVYSQSVSDVVAAEIRRDEAKKVKDEAFQKLEQARAKYGNNNNNSNNKFSNKNNDNNNNASSNGGNGNVKQFAFKNNNNKGPCKNFTSQEF